MIRKLLNILLENAWEEKLSLVRMKMKEIGQLIKDVVRGPGVNQES